MINIRRATVAPPHGAERSTRSRLTTTTHRSARSILKIKLAELEAQGKLIELRRRRRQKDEEEELIRKRLKVQISSIQRITHQENHARLCVALKGNAKEAVAALLSRSGDPTLITYTLEQCFGQPDEIVKKLLQRTISRRQPPQKFEHTSYWTIRLINEIPSWRTGSSLLLWYGKTTYRAINRRPTHAFADTAPVP
ncbi:hypothetical protein EVAR_103761_1 [Eumeta japonica]|uniref:Uncharacterized protein n=1 Tax=Eumeta variegata TaxID=151549 RepID=A0A4C2A9Y1_EUMVA|nr:hypothetical protein EVAR_103761_1 [Eumeta japonica]